MAALSLITKTWKQHKCPSAGHKVRYIRTIEHYSTVQRKEQKLLHATWMKLNYIILTEKNRFKIIHNI